MANKVIGFTIDIEGVDSINDLNKSIKQTEEQLKKLTVGTEEYAATAEKLGKLKAAQAEVRKEQAQLTKSFRESTKELSAFDKARAELKGLEKQLKSLSVEGKENSEQANKLKTRISELQGVVKKANAEVKAGDSAYKKASKRLNELRQRYKDLAIEGKGSTREAEKLKNEIKQLDKTLKKTDKQVGQFGRNVGNYPRLFGLSTKALGEFIPGLDKLSERLDKATGGSNVLGKALLGGFLAFKAGKVLIDVFKQFDELIKKIDETRNAIGQLSGLSGEDLDKLTSDVTGLASTFGIESDEITDSAKKLSEDLGISFEAAVAKIEKGLLAGTTSTEDFFEIIEESPEKIDQLSEATGEYSDRQQELLSANKELAAAQIELTNEFAGSASEVKAFANRALAQLIKTALALVDAFKPVVNVVFEIGKSLGELIGSLFGAGDAAKGVQNIFKLLANVIKISADASLFFINSLRAGVDFIRGDASTAYKLFTKEGQILAKAQERLADTTKDLTSEYQNETKELNSLFGQLANTNANTDERRELIEKLNDQYGEYLPNIDLEKAGQEDLAEAYDATTKAIAQNLIDRKKIEIQSKAQSQVLEDNIELARVFEKEREAFKERERLDEEFERLKRNNATSVTIGRTIKARAKANRELNAARRERIKLQKESNVNRAAAKKEIELLDKASADLVNTLSEFITLTDAQSDATEEAARRAAQDAKEREVEKAKRDAEAAKAALARQKKLLEQLRKEREKFLKSEGSFIGKQIQLLGKLRERQEKLIIEGISDLEQKARTKAKQAQADRIAQAEANFAKLQEFSKAREAEALRLFGADSEELLSLQKQNAEALKESEEDLAGIRIRERIALTNQLLKIEQDFIEKRAAQRQKQLDQTLAGIKQEADLSKLVLEQRLAEGKISEEEFNAEIFKLQKDRIQKEIDLLKEREEAVAQSGSKIAKEQNAQILTEKQKLYTELAKLDKSFSDQQEANAQAVSDSIEQENAQRLESYKQGFSQVVSGLEQGLGFLNDIQSASDERRAQSLTKQEQDNQLQNEQLQERLSQATGLEAQFLQQQISANVGAAETIAKERQSIANDQARQAKERAIIDSVIQTVLAAVEALPNVPLSIFVGAVGAAATAKIAAQPLAKGGKVGQLSGEVIQFNTGGRVTNRGNIKPLSNGDNVLATLKTGEAVLTEEQQDAIGGPAVLKAAGVPNFAEGGRVGAPIAFTQKANTLANDQTEVSKKLQEAIEATNGRIDRLQVNWTAESQDEQDKGLDEREQIKANASF